MIRFARTMALVCALGLLTSAGLAAQSASLQAEMLRDWTALQATMAKIAAEMPEDTFSYKPTPPQRDYGQQILHVAQINARFLGMLGASAPAPTVDPKTTGKAAIIKVMDDTFAYGTAVLKQQTDQTMLQEVANPPAFLGPSTRARMFTFLIGHTWDIYGQMAVYLRLTDLVPPASQRP
ncbi:MAG: DinB family protein [Acidobacteria bacterium]|nr:DinB family protein [Acidobacteriota bacterium]